MNTIPCRCTPGSQAADRVRRTAALLALASLTLGSQLQAQEHATPQEEVAAQALKAAVLKRQQIDFSYRSSTAHLSCVALRGRIASILRALGARDDVEVDVNGCDAVAMSQEPMETWRTPSDRGRISSDRWGTSSSPLSRRGFRQSQSANVRVRLMMPVEVTPDVLAEIKRDKSRRELVSRVIGHSGASLDDPIVFPAQRQIVTLSRRTLDLEPEECELLEQMSASVFPKLGIRVVRRNPSCGRDQISHISPQITVEALMPVMPSSPQLELELAPPAAGEGEAAPSAPADSEAESSESGAG